MKETMDQNNDHMTPAMQKALRMMASRQSAHQGPHDMKQAAALAEYLRDTLMAEGMDPSQIVETLVSMLNHPTDFAEEFAQVQGREAPPEIEGEAAGQPMPAMEEAPPENTMPMPGMQPPPGSTTAKVAADNIAGKCPNCNSHTTGIVGEKGKSMCHACNKTFTTKEVIDDSVDTSKSSRLSADEEPSKHDHEDLHMHDDSVPSTMRWVDNSGQPIEVGKEYKMLSNRSDIPDFVKVLGPGQIDPETGQMGGSVIGDTLKYEISGEYGLNHTGDLTIDEFDDEEISFEPTNDGDDYGDADLGPNDMLENNGNSDRTMFEGVPEQTDLSQPTSSVKNNLWGRHARNDEFARPEGDRPNHDKDDPSFPLIDAPCPNKFSSTEEFDTAMEEWRNNYLAPSLNHRSAKSLTNVMKRKIASGDEIGEDLWNRIDSVGGPHYAADEEITGPHENRPSPDEDHPDWHGPTPDDLEILGDMNGQVGRGLVMEREGQSPVLHTWPISIAERMNNPASELTHSQHLQDIGWNPDTDGRTAMFDISTDGPDSYSVDSNPVFEMTDGDRQLLEHHHPELARRPMMSKTVGKTAGFDYNLMEQREFIGENGIARNSDKLDLENTHYADAAMEDHFLFGLL